MNDTKDRKDTPQQGASAEEQAASAEPGVAVADGGGGEGGDAAPDDPEMRLAAAERRAEESRDQWLRARAELENLRKRTERQLEQARKYAIEGFAFEMLAVKDNLELALRELAAPEDGDEAGNASGENSRRHGVELTLKVLTRAFDKFGIEEINPRREAFDPERHQAMLTQPSAEHPQGTILGVMQKGYSVRGRLLRPALVAVAGAAPEGGDGGDGRDSDAGDAGDDAENLNPPQEKGL